MIDPEQIVEERRALREQRPHIPAPLPSDHCTARKCLALWRGDRWPVSAIAAHLEFPETHVRALIAQALTTEKAA